MEEVGFELTRIGEEEKIVLRHSSRIGEGERLLFFPPIKIVSCQSLDLADPFHLPP